MKGLICFKNAFVSWYNRFIPGASNRNTAMKKTIVLTTLYCLLKTVVIAQVQKTPVADFAKSIDSLKQVVTTAKDDSIKVNAYHMLGSFLAGTNAAEAIYYCKKGAALGKKVDYKKGIAVCMVTVSYCYGLLNNLKESNNYIDSAIIYYKMINKLELLPMCYNNRAENGRKLGRLKQALSDCDTAMYYAELTNRKGAKRSINKMMAAVYLAQKNYEQSRLYYEKAYADYDLAKDYITTADILNQLGNIDEKTKRYDQAIGNFEKAIAIALEIKQENNLSEYHYNLSNAWLKKNDKRKAEIHALKAIEYATAKKNKTQLAAAQTMLSTVYLDKDSTAAAISLASQSFNLAAGTESKEMQQNSAAALAYGYYKEGNFKKAFDYLEVSKKLSDSFSREKYDKDVAALQTSFRVNEKDREIQLLNKDKALQQQEIKQQRLVMIAAAAIALLALSGIWLLINRNKLRQRMKELELRNQIAADLHDEVGSSLSSIHMLSQMAEQAGDEKKNKDILARVSSNARETMDKMGDIVWMIKPDETRSDSLLQRMERFAHEIASGKNVKVNMEINDLEKLNLSMDQRKNIYLIFKEAINNAVKYSGTEIINVTADVRSGRLLLAIKDFGKGFDIDQVNKGNGLDNMEKRAKDLGGTLGITSDHAGTSTILTVDI